MKVLSVSAERNLQGTGAGAAKGTGFRPKIKAASPPLPGCNRSDASKRSVMESEEPAMAGAVGMAGMAGVGAGAATAGTVLMR
jgi:hypothetical protein